MTIIESKRLILRTWKESDLIPFAAMNHDSEVMMFFPAVLSHEETAAFYKKITASFDQNGFGLFAAELKQTQEFIGFIGFARPAFSSYFTPCIEIGWRLDKHFWNRGFATEGAKACLEYGFLKLDFKEVVSFTATINTRSINVMKRIGMVYDNIFEHPGLPDGHMLKTHVLYKISRDEFSST